MKNFIGVAGIAALFGSAAIAQLNAPVFGYLPDGPRLRPVYGIRGAASVAPPLDLGRDFGKLAVSPLQDYALATDAVSGAVLLVPSGGTPMELTGAPANPDRIAISPTGSSAVLWFSSNHHAHIVSGLPNAPVSRDVDVSSLAGDPATLAISDDGQWLAGAWKRGVYAVGSNSPMRPLPVREQPSAMSFYAGRHDLLLATGFHVFSITDVGGNEVVSTLSGQRITPAGIGISSDNRRVVVADHSGLLYAIDLTSGATSQFDCGCTPEGVFAMGRGGMFRLTGLASGAFRALDSDRGELLYIPLMAGQGGQQ